MELDNIDDEVDENDVYDDEIDCNIALELMKFRVFISSKRLLQMASKANVIQTDATYKLIWNGFPVIIIGTSDMNNVFHPFGIAICLRLADFLNTANELVKEWSTRRDSSIASSKKFCDVASLTTELFTKAYHWLKDEKPVIRLDGEHTQFYTSSEESKNSVTNAMVKHYNLCVKNLDFDSFDNMRQILFSTWCITSQKI
jgi:hypothetical protein